MTAPFIEVPLHRLAHARAGDKGNRLNISLIAYDRACWELLIEQVTEAFVMKGFAARDPSRVRRYLLPQLGAMNFVLDDVLDGGVNRSLALDRHGKTLSYKLLSLTVKIPQHLLPPS
ncbi:MAG: hypothetical protein GYB21_11855 [Oceanospirillales bacterium]|nr:hypothetical protein [Oceanospirillales bacterium]